MVPGHCRNAIPRRDAETLRQAQRRRRRIEQAVTTRGGNSRSAGKPRDSPGPRGHPPRGAKAAPWDTRVSPQVCGIALRETPRVAVTGQRGEETGGMEGGGFTGSARWGAEKAEEEGRASLGCTRRSLMPLGVTQSPEGGGGSCVGARSLSALGCVDGGRFCDANRWITRTPPGRRRNWTPTAPAATGIRQVDRNKN